MRETLELIAFKFGMLKPFVKCTNRVGEVRLRKEQPSEQRNTITARHCHVLDASPGIIRAIN